MKSSLPQSLQKRFNDAVEGLSENKIVHDVVTGEKSLTVAVKLPSSWEENPIVKGAKIRRLEHQIPNKETISMQMDCKEGGRLEMHSHPSEEYVVCLSGRMEISVGTEKVVLKRHESCTIKENTKHEFKCLKDGSFVVSWLRDLYGIAHI